MALTPDQRRQLHVALLDAFDIDSLEQLTALHLGVQLNHVTKPGRFSAVALDLITWAEQQGRVRDLMTAMLADAPGNELVTQTARNYGISSPALIPRARGPGIPTMNLAKAFINLLLLAVGGVLGNLIAGWIRTSLWGNNFTAGRLIGVFVGCLVLFVMLAWLDTGGSQRRGAGQQSGVSNVLQVGNSLIRLITGSNRYNIRNVVQIGPGRIEVGNPSLDDRRQSPEADNE